MGWTCKYYEWFYSQRYNAKARGIEWHFTFEEWLAWWGDDIDNRGHAPGKFVMARHGDVGPYHPDNVRKATHKENTAEARNKRINTPAGIFNSLKEASEHYKVKNTTLGYRLKRYPTQYFYV
jgi:hypothetical protein